MEISITDKFKTKEELIEAVNLYGEHTNVKFTMQETARTLLFVCNGKQEFNCDASIVTCHRKKEQSWIIKRMKLTHKCLVQNGENPTTDICLRSEIINNIENYDKLKIGDIVQILYNRSIRVTFSSVYYILRSKKDIETKSIHGNGLSDNGMFSVDPSLPTCTNLNGEFVTKYEFYDSDKVELSYCTDATAQEFNEINDVINEYCKELKGINDKKIDLCFCGKMAYYKCVEYAEVLYNIPEIKYYEKSNGTVIYGVLYDPFQEPIIYSCCVAEGVSIETIVKYFLQKTSADAYIVEYDWVLIEILDMLNIKYFVKTRDVCKYVYSIDGDKDNIENVWNICNGISDDKSKKGRYKKYAETLSEDRRHSDNKLSKPFDVVADDKENAQSQNTQKTVDSGSSDFKINQQVLGSTKDTQYNSTDTLNKGAGYGISKKCNSSLHTADSLCTLLKLAKDKFIKPEFDYKLLNYNNLHECDVDFICYSTYSLPLVECLNAIIKLSMDNLRSKKKLATDNRNVLFGPNVISRIEKNLATTVSDNFVADLEQKSCTCGMYQELLIPCVHACSVLKEHRLDPYMYVSTIYSKEQYTKLREVKPVVNINLRLQPDKFYTRKGPGRPKKEDHKGLEVTV